MKKALIILFLILYQNILYQNSNIKRSYEVTFCGKPQTIKLIEYKNGIVKGFLLTNLTKEKENKKDRKIIKKISFSDTQVKRMLTDLSDAGIETLKKCDEDIECEGLGFLDGDYLKFNILANGTNKHIVFSEIYPESQINGKLEEIELRKKAQLLVTIIDKEINLKEQFSNLIKSLKKGRYCYWIGISQVCMKHKEIGK